MKTLRSAFVLLCAVAYGAVMFASPQATPNLEDTAKDLTRQLAARQFGPVVKQFDPAMTSAMPAMKLAEVWDGLIGQAGAFQSVETTHSQEVQGYRVVLVTSKFEKATLNIKWVFDSSGRVAGLFFLPLQPAVSWTPPPFADPSSFHEQPITVGDAPWLLSGTLTLPNGIGPFPAVVLVAGSGPQDQDETILANKPFKDIAWGLASRNIAVVRYNKRTLQYAKELPTEFTVNEETVIDARAAAALLSKQPAIDPRRIFVLGHSLGGTLAPRIAQGDAGIAGLIILAGGTRPFERTLVEQLKYVAGLQGNIGPEAQKQIDDAEQSATEIENPNLAPDTKLNILGSPISGAYFLDLRDHPPAQIAAQLKVPMLILRGDRDYQVTEADFSGWKNALSGKPEVSFKVYPGLFHLFMPSSSAGPGLGTPADYQKPSHVAVQVIDDISTWIHGIHGHINEEPGRIPGE